MKTDINLVKKWVLPKPIDQEKIDNCILNNTLQKVLIRRGIDLNNQLDEYLEPSELPNPEHHFIELNKATQRIIDACERNELIAICGDYDADGITSTVLLLELLSNIGGNVKTFIPSRQDDGYGLNTKMIDEINSEEIKLVITVDNGISAFDAINMCKKLSIDLIITDHHKIPDFKLDIYALIHPQLAPTNSPYKYLAGVGIAYLLARNICSKINYDLGKTSASVFFCIGTIADMAPLQGANRKWLKDCLPEINKTTNKGIKSIFKKLYFGENVITSEDIGYKIAPLINAVGRIGDPKVIIELLREDSAESIAKLTKECFAMNRKRKRITSQIEQEALEIATAQYASDRKFLVLVKRDWHTGVIGIVAARMVDKFNLPTAIISVANDGIFRGSIRSNNRLMVNKALDECNDLLIAHGGHSAAAGFSIIEENIPILIERLNSIAKEQFKNIDLYKSINPDAYLVLRDINDEFYKQLCMVGPFGVKNPAPIFWTRKCRIIKMFKLNGGHVRLILDDGTSSIEAIKWNLSNQISINDLIDIAYYIELNRWKNKAKIQLNIIDLKNHNNTVHLQIHKNVYKCKLTENKNILITNKKGQCYCTDLSLSNKQLNHKESVYAKKILPFAEIALGKAA